MRIQEVADAIHVCFDAGIVPYLWGDTGIGKTSTYRDWAKAHDHDFFALHLAQQDQADMLGGMEIRAHRTCWAEPSWWPCAEVPHPMLLVLDEFNRCRDESVAAGAMQLILDRRLHVHELPDDCLIAAAGNPHGGSYSVESLRDPAIISRFCHIYVTTEVWDWSLWADDPDNDVPDEVIAHLEDHPEELTRTRGAGFSLDVQPNPRGWELVGKLCKVKARDRLKPHVYEELVAGLVGPSSARLFVDPPDSNLKEMVEKGRLPEALEHGEAVLRDAIREPVQGVKGLLEVLEVLPKEARVALLGKAMRDDGLAVALKPHEDALLRLVQ